MKTLNSVFKNVPHHVWEEFVKYKTKNSIHKIRTKNREPVRGLMTEQEIKSYNQSGSLSKRQSQSVDVYVGGLEDQYSKGYNEGRRSLSHLQDANRELVARIQGLEEKLGAFDGLKTFLKEVTKNG